MKSAQKNVRAELWRRSARPVGPPLTKKVGRFNITDVTVPFFI